MSVELVTDVDDKIIQSFDCEEDSINEFLQDFAKNYHTTGEGVTHVVIDDDINKIVGYYTLKCNALQSESSCGDKEVYPAIEIARLGVDKDYKGKGNGKLILADAFETIKSITDVVGVKMVFLYALPDAEKFYQHAFKFSYFGSSYKNLECEDSMCAGMYKLL